MDDYVSVNCPLGDWIDMVGDAAVLIDHMMHTAGEVPTQVAMLSAMSIAMIARDTQHPDHENARAAIEGARTLEAVREGEGAARH